MNRILTITLVFPLALCGPSLSAEEDWVAQSNAIAATIMAEQARFTPETFSFLGVEAADAEVVDLNPKVYERTRRMLRQQLAQLDDLEDDVNDTRVRQDVQILAKSVGDNLETARLNHEFLLPYYNLSEDIFFGFRSLLDPRNDPARFPAALERLKKYTGKARGYKPITELAIARSWERFDTPGLLGPYRNELDKDLANVARFNQGIENAFAESGLEGWQGDLATLQAQLIDYSDWLRKEMLPRTREDHRLPEELYANNLKSFGVDADPRQLIRDAQLGFASIQVQMQSVARQIAGQRGLPSADYRDVIRELGKEQVAADVVLEVYRSRLEQIEAIIREHELVTLPERPAAIRLATEAEAAASPAPFMSPPQLLGNTGQPGEFVLVTRNPNDDSGEPMNDFGSEASTWALTAHEARPGHEMQFAAMLEGGVSTARAIYALNSANIEGWGLYAEVIVYPYLPLEAQLFALRSLQMRAARAFLDPMLNLGLIDRDRALDFLMDEVVLSRPMAVQEVDRYTFAAPGQATSYYTGYMNLMALRTEVELHLRERFNQRKFHDFLLAQGVLPPDLLRTAVLSDFVPAELGTPQP